MYTWIIHYVIQNQESNMQEMATVTRLSLCLLACVFPLTVVGKPAGGVAQWSDIYLKVTILVCQFDFTCMWSVYVCYHISCDC